MKKSIIALFILSILILIGCKISRSNGSKAEINLADVESITIGDGLEDSTAITLVRSDVITFVNKWNSSTPKGMCKYRPEHWFIVKMKDGSTRKFRQGGETMKENNDYCFDVGSNEAYKGLYR